MDHASDLSLDESHLRVADIILIYGQHCELTPEGIVLLKSGHHKIHLHVLSGLDIGAAVAAVMESILTNFGFSEDTFAHRHRPGSVFRALSNRSIGFVPTAYKLQLRNRLGDPNPLISRRAAKLLIHIYDTAISYPDMETLLHCYFRVDWLTPDKFTLYVRNRLIQAATRTSFEREYLALSSGLEKFADEFGGPVATAAMGTEAGRNFDSSMQLLFQKLANQYRLRSAVFQKLKSDGQVDAYSKK